MFPKIYSLIIKQRYQTLLSTAAITQHCKTCKMKQKNGQLFWSVNGSNTLNPNSTPISDAQPQPFPRQHPPQSFTQQPPPPSFPQQPPPPSFPQRRRPQPVVQIQQFHTTQREFQPRPQIRPHIQPQPQPQPQPQFQPQPQSRSQFQQQPPVHFIVNPAALAARPRQVRPQVNPQPPTQNMSTNFVTEAAANIIADAAANAIADTAVNAAASLIGTFFQS